MALTQPVRHARAGLIWLAIIHVLLGGLLAAGVFTNQTTWAPKLALDLEGGTQMILAPRVQGDSQISQEQLDQAVEIIRQRVDGTGVSEAEITTQSGRNVVVSMPGTPDAKTRELIQASANMEFRPVITGAPWTATAAADRTADADIPAPTAEPANASDTNWITKALYKKFEAYDCPTELASAERPENDPAKPAITCDPGTQYKYIVGPVEVPGTDISDASFGMANNSQGISTGQWAVNLEFNSEGADKFRQVTERLVSATGFQNQFAILLDGVVLSAPTANAVIADGRAQITGSFTEESARALSEQLKYGALPISFEIQSEQQISATLGQDQLKMGLIAGIIGLALVAIYSLFQYRALGFVTILSLIIAGVLTYLAIAILGWVQNYRLSLAGVAGIIVAIGLTADSFIVYFERVRDELRSGRPLTAAVEVGWDRARRTILASKAVNLLAAVVLYIVAVGNVRGFAFTLGLTAIADLIVVFLFTHPMLQLLARTKFFGEGHPLSGMDPRLLGVEPFYQGAGKFRSPATAGAASADSQDDDAANGSQRSLRDVRKAERNGERLTIAERRRLQDNSSVTTGDDKGQGADNA
ncbi:protein translocase subunit SecD [Neomicrococcus aestuarii]|uniref:Protein translocase subunit SecD n=1 Tax=Neomicrococcus aestuarii TaxID=556325 RepID=A0A1L2ZLG1_9MICC|nr:protein translocase subunit SecD [Neomicrococcus aestuarii]APF40039.1 protein-export membrane protein SecD [Neomicrococcus aestuarii]